MPLPLPRAGDPPAVAKITLVAHAAILDDGTVDREIRVAVLFDLESTSDVDSTFASICRDEELAGPKVATGVTLQLGRAISFDDFTRGLTSGWFGAAGMAAADARAFVTDLKGVLASSGDADGAVAIIRASLDPGTPVPTLDRRVTWYFYDEDLPEDPLSHVASNLAHRLALPGVKGKKIEATNPKDYIVFSIPITSIDEPRKPRFTDSGELKFLEVWRPGGKTAPWIAGCLGLDEAVGAPTILARSISDVRSTQCYEP